MVDANRQTTAPIDSNTISDFSAGLNTISRTTQLQRGETPYAKNIVVREDGVASARPGTELISFNSNVIPSGCRIDSFNLPSGASYMVVKLNTSALVYRVEETNFKLIWTQGIFPEQASAIKPDSVFISDSVPRLVMVTGVSAPVQISFVESNTRLTGTPTFRIETVSFNSGALEFATLNDLVLFANGEVISIKSITYSNGVLTCTLQNVLQGSFLFELVYISWQWWCQAKFLRGADISQAAVRFNSQPVDKAVPIPPRLLRNIEQLSDSSIPVKVFDTTSRGSEFAINADGLQNNATTFSFSNGSVGDGGTSRVPLGVTHITFGALRAGGLPEDLWFLRLIRTSDFAPAPATDIEVSIGGGNFINRRMSDNIVAGAFTNSDPMRIGFTLRQAPNFHTQAGGVVGPTDLNYTHLAFDAATIVGVPFVESVEIFCLSTVGVSIGAVKSVSKVGKPVAAAAVPAYGIQEHASYRDNFVSFPRTIELYQGRLVLGGFPGNPTKVVFSDVAGTNPIGRDFADFQTLWKAGEPIDPVTTVVSSNDSGSRITAMSVSAGKLLVFTDKKTHSISGGSSLLSPTSLVTSVVANIGALNSRATVGVDNSVFFLSSGGLFRLSPSIEVGDFQVRQVSQKINNLLKNPNNSETSFLMYDTINSVLYMAVTDKIDSPVANRMFVYYLSRDAWSEFTTFSHEFKCSHASVLGLRTFRAFFSMFMLANNNAAQNHVIAGFPSTKLLNTDFTYDDARGILAANALLTWPMVKQQYSVSTGTQNKLTVSLFKMSEYLEIEDIAVFTAPGTDTSNRQRLVFGEDFVKLSEREVSFNYPLSPGDLITIYPIDSSGNYPFRTFKGLASIPSEFTFSPTDFMNTVTLQGTGILSTERMSFGYSIPYCISTPGFTRNTLTEQKQMYELFALLDNSQRKAKFSGSTAPDNPELVDKWINRVRLVMGRYNNVDYFSEDSYEQVRTDGKWDIHTFDFSAGQAQQNDYQLIKSSLVGSSHVSQTFFYNFGDGVFDIVSYQLMLKRIGRK